MNIDVRDTEIIIDSKVLAFPASFSDLQDILGEARIVPKMIEPTIIFSTSWA